MSSSPSKPPSFVPKKADVAAPSKQLGASRDQGPAKEAEAAEPARTSADPTQAEQSIIPISSIGKDKTDVENVPPPPAMTDALTEDSDELVSRVSGCLVRMRTGKLRQRRAKWLLAALLVILAGGLLAWWFWPDLQNYLPAHLVDSLIPAEGTHQY